jgi:hypothetical protein
MREGATLKLDNGEEIRVDVDTDDLDEVEIVVRRTESEHEPSKERLVAWIEQHLATAKRYPAGTTDRWLAGDRDR